MGNPLLWWGSLPCLVFTGWLAFKQRDRAAIFIGIAFAAQWLLFAAIPRIIFIYHYYPNVIFLALATSFCLERWWPRRRRLILTYLGVCLAAFFIIYPLISGLPLPPDHWLDQVLQWFRNWRI
jgi:dolichyl-phosphate-mannose--protein O-mannosyl transferase